MTNDPFDIDGPAMISFSGGRTSAYMLRRMLDVGVQRHVHVLFANTGKERDETLDFVHEIETTWGVGIHWIEYFDDGDTPSGSRYREVTYETASRDGAPFTRLIEKRSYLPNPVTRFCTTDLKIKPMRDWMRAHGYDDSDWTNIVGIRADEPRRVARMRGKNSGGGRWDCALPLADAGIVLGDVTAFWNAQPFDLRLQSHEGNCDLCFLKGLSKKNAIIRDEPTRAVWWANREAAIGATFRKDQPSYAAMMEQTPLLFSDDDDLIECACTD